MKLVLRAFALVHCVLAFLFACATLMLVVIAAKVGWAAFSQGLTTGAAQQIIEAVGLLAAAVVALQIAQTIAEEEVVRSVHVSAPTRVRRYMSRFLVVLVVALTIEALVVTFQAAHGETSTLAYAAAMVFAVGALLAGWGAFIGFNRGAEELEPEAMQEAKSEDRKLK